MKRVKRSGLRFSFSLFILFVLVLWGGSFASAASEADESEINPAENSSVNGNADEHDARIEIRVQAGWDGMVVVGRPYPVKVNVSNQGLHTREGLVEVVPLFEEPRVSAQQPVYRRPMGSTAQALQLTPGAEKELIFWLEEPANVVHVFFHREASSRPGETWGETEIRLRQQTWDEWPFVGVIRAPDERSGAESGIDLKTMINQVEIRRDGLALPPRMAEVALDELPEQAERIHAFRLLVLNGSSLGAKALNEGQRQALAGWIERGGTLVLGTGLAGKEALKVLPDGFLNVDGGLLPVGTTLDLKDLRNWVGHADGMQLQQHESVQTTAATDLRQHVSEGAPPALRRIPIGRGQIILLAWDLRTGPLSDAPVQKAFWQRLFDDEFQHGSHGRYQGEQSDIRSFWNGALSSISRDFPASIFPNWQLLFVLLGSFALLAGPGAYMYLRRKDQRERIWLLVPCLALVVSTSFYAWGRMEGRDRLVNAAAVLTREHPGAPLSADIALAYYAPTHGELRVDLPPGVEPSVGSSNEFMEYTTYGPIRRTSMTMSRNLSPMQTTPYRIVLRDDKTEVSFSSLSRWAARSLFLRQTESRALGSLAAEIDLLGSELSGTVRNDTGHWMKNVFLMAGQQVVRLGDMAPSEELSVRLSVPNNALGMYGYYGNGSWTMFQLQKGQTANMSIPWTPDSNLPPPVPPSDPEVRRWANFIEPLFYHNEVMSSLPLAVFGWSEADLVGVSKLVQDNPNAMLSFVWEPLAIRLPAGPVRIPGGLAQARVIDRTSSGWGTNGTGSGANYSWWMNLEDGHITFSYRPPLVANEVEHVVWRHIELELPNPQVQSSGMVSNTGSMHRSISGVVAKSALPSRSLVASSGGDDDEVGEAVPPFQIFDWNRSEWVALDMNPGEKQELPASSYLNAHGEARVRIHSSAGDFQPPTLAFVGEVRR